MSRVHIVTYKGKELIYLDFEGCRSAELMPHIEEARSLIARRPAASALVLTNVKGTQLNREASQIMKDFATANKPYVKASCVIGIEGLTSIFFKAVQTVSGRNISSFDTINEAKEWLVAQ
jgi:hypothetical protein